MDPRLAQAQTQFYVTQLEQRQSFRPFAFMTNGQDIYFWDVGRANKRLVMGFFSADDLENLLYLRQAHIPLTAAPVNTRITNRSYQLEAIRRVAEVFEQGKRKALLVTATGTGKTRVAMALGAGRPLSTHQPGPAHPVRGRPGRAGGAGDPRGFRGVEVHRSIFNKWNEVLQYFDGRMVGLTATPAAFLDRNTFLEFECFDGKPTFLYGHEEAVADGCLVDFDLYAAQTKFQRKGIKGVDLSEEERNSLVEQGLDPDAIDFSGTDLEQRVSNRDTLRKQWQEIMDQCRKDESGQLPGKTIVFVMTQEHALRLVDVFEEMYPQFPGLAQVITYKWASASIAGANLPRLSPSLLAEYEIPLPSLPEQQRIAGILSRADRLRRLRRYALEMSEGYLQSVFLEMFGDPATNPLGWEPAQLSSTFACKPQIGTAKPAHGGGRQLVVRVGEIGGHRVALEQCASITLAGNDLKRFTVKEGDLLLARAIGSIDHLGKASIMQSSNNVYLLAS